MDQHSGSALISFSFSDEKLEPVDAGHPILGSFILRWRIPREELVRAFWRRIQKATTIMGGDAEKSYFVDDCARELGVECLVGWLGCTPEAVQACIPDQVGDEQIATMQASLAAAKLSEFPFQQSLKAELVARSQAFGTHAMTRIGLAASRLLKMVEEAKAERKNDLPSGVLTGASEGTSIN